MRNARVGNRGIVRQSNIWNEAWQLKSARIMQMQIEGTWQEAFAHANNAFVLSVDLLHLPCGNFRCRAECNGAGKPPPDQTFKRASSPVNENRSQPPAQTVKGRHPLSATCKEAMQKIACCLTTSAKIARSRLATQGPMAMVDCESKFDSRRSYATPSQVLTASKRKPWHSAQSLGKSQLAGQTTS